MCDVRVRMLVCSKVIIAAMKFYSMKASKRQQVTEWRLMLLSVVAAELYSTTNNNMHNSIERDRMTDKTTISFHAQITMLIQCERRTMGCCRLHQQSASTRMSNYPKL